MATLTLIPEWNYRYELQVQTLPCGSHTMTLLILVTVTNFNCQFDTMLKITLPKVRNSQYNNVYLHTVNYLNS